MQTTKRKGSRTLTSTVDRTARLMPPFLYTSPREIGFAYVKAEVGVRIRVSCRIDRQAFNDSGVQNSNPHVKNK